MMSKFLPFEEALVVARSLEMASKSEWYAWCKEGMRPAYLPANPDRTYKDGGWQGWVHWLGSSDLKPPPFLPFAQALAVARSLKLASVFEWNVWCKEGMRPAYLPSHPDRTYKGAGWQGWGHWLGTGNQGNPTVPFLPFEEALAVARSLNLASSNEWKVWSREGLRPPDVPASPGEIYKDRGWQGWGHWLGTGNQGNPTVPFLPFEDALAVARSLGLASSTEWRAWCKEGMCPPNVPRGPNEVYKDAGWQGWGHWLGTGNKGNPTVPFLPFGEALAVARSLGLASSTEWAAWCKEGLRPPNVPSAPDQTYKDRGWQGWGHWLGTGNQRTKEFLPFAEALAVAQSLNLASSKEWCAWRKEGMCPPNMPSHPNVAYKGGGWQGWGHWLGTGNQSSKTKTFLPFEEALAVAQALGLASRTEWIAWCKEGLRPPNVPSLPSSTYKDVGWQGWGHWLGTGNLAAATARPASKRPATGCAGASGNSSGQRQRL